ncbi:hypothetical protein ILUMI_25075, partial [Ignelater luminosus]
MVETSLCRDPSIQNESFWSKKQAKCKNNVRFGQGKWQMQSDDGPERYRYTASKTGWMQNHIFYNYFEKSFLSTIDEQKPILVIYDEHNIPYPHRKKSGTVMSGDLDGQFKWPLREMKRCRNACRKTSIQIQAMWLVEPYSSKLQIPPYKLV